MSCAVCKIDDRCRLVELVNGSTAILCAPCRHRHDEMIAAVAIDGPEDMRAEEANALCAPAPSSNARGILIAGIGAALAAAVALSGCGDNVVPRECEDGEVYAAQTCHVGTITCQAPGGAPVVGCMLHLLHRPGEPYDAVCVPDEECGASENARGG